MSDGRPTIEADGLWKIYRVYRGHGRGWVQSLLMPWRPVGRFADDMVALRDVSLRVGAGESLAVLGRNGSGKSTLLRVLAGVTEPTRGSVAVHGRMRCVMSSGVGFNPRLTGRENVVYGSIAMGIPRHAALERMDAIVEFAGLGSEIDKPTLYYSQGMRGRLALAVALQETAEVLILDEALAAGDAGFTEQCRRRIDDLCAGGQTVIIATHALGVAARACTRAILLQNGEVVEDGAPADVVQAYRASLPGAQTDVEAPEQNADGAVELVDAYLCGPDGRPRDRFARGQPLELHVRLVTSRPIAQPRILLEVVSADTGARVTQLGTHYLDAKTKRLETLRPDVLDGCYELTVAWPQNPLGSGEFFWRVTVAPWTRPEDAGPVAHLRASPVCPFESVSFPERRWQRRTILEAESTLELRPAAEQDQAVGEPPRSLGLT